jgi:DNA polymerase III epsilon subunit-like protein
MSKTQISIDIETLGTTPGCIVLSIGACEFDDRGEILGTFHTHIDVEDSMNCGMHVDASTILWWLAQSKEAQDAITNACPCALDETLAKLQAAFDWTDKRVWCNGAAFDFPILTAAHNKVGKKVPWAYYNEMDMRTLKGLCTKAEWNQFKVAPTLKHDGLADAIAQAKTIANWQRAQLPAVKAEA